MLKRFVLPLMVFAAGVVLLGAPPPEQLGFRFRVRPPAAAAPEGDRNDYFDTLSALPERIAAWSLRDQDELDDWVKQPPSTIWTYNYPSQVDTSKCQYDAAPWTSGSRTCNDDYSDPQDGAKVYKRPREEFSTWSPIADHPNANINSLGDVGDEAVYLPLRLPLRSAGGGISSGSFLLTWDFWWAPEIQTNRGTVGTWKSFGIMSSNNGNDDGGSFYYLSHDKMAGGDFPFANNATSMHSNMGLGAFAPGVGEDDPFCPSGDGGRVMKNTESDPDCDDWNAFNTLYFHTETGKWTRYWILVEIDQPIANFTSWTAFQQLVNGSFAMTGTDYDMFSMWAADEDSDPVRLYYKVPLTRTDTHFARFRPAFDTSTSNSGGGGLDDAMISYISNVVVLENYTVSEANTTLFAKPVP